MNAAAAVQMIMKGVRYPACWPRLMEDDGSPHTLNSDDAFFMYHEIDLCI